MTETTATLTAKDLKTYLEANSPVAITLTDACDGCVVTVEPQDWPTLARYLKETPDLAFHQLTDICAIDYLHYGMAEWGSDDVSRGGSFSRGSQRLSTQSSTWKGPRFALAYQLLSLVHNRRLRVKVLLPENQLEIDSVVSVWEGANWLEREAYDMMGIRFRHHPDLRRILTDYGFIGHPFRKDFPLSGHVEMRYDAARGACIYEPVDIQPRTVIPKVIRHDQRYSSDAADNRATGESSHPDN